MPVVLTGPSAIDWVDEVWLSVLVVLRDASGTNVGIALSSEPLSHYPTNFFPTFSFAVRESTDRCRIYE
jgi:hypothetical protein